MKIIPQSPTYDQPLIEVVNVSKRFRLQREYQRSFQDLFIRLWKRQRSEVEYFWPLRDISLQIYPGDSIGILGQNGSGKSTLLKVITGVLPPTSGYVCTNGRIASLLELGAGFHPDLTGRENVFLNGSIYGMDRATIRRKLDQIIEFAELGDFIDTPVKHYSSGMYVRLGFSVAIHTSPDVLIIDEVLTVGDQIFQQKCLQRIYEMKAAGVAIVLVSHNLEDIRRLCDRAIWLQNGLVRADGPANDIVDDYLAYTNELYYARRRAEQAATTTKTQEDPTPSEQRRWGTHQAEIIRVELCNEQGKAVDQFQQGATLCVRIYYKCHERILRPTFGLAIYRQDGTHVNGPNSVDEGYHIEAIEDYGMMEYRIDSLPLNPGRYELTVAIYNRNSTIAIDHHHRMYPFEVLQPRGRAEEGVVHIPATWRHVSSIEPALTTEIL
ncbi:ABC transporter ATP-binding protein [Litorilinea aerophila]|uniref:ABC transporter ATP-binding protein n=1 Tax=Litorilinea aerophila TaxID=1204385 RepID=A0A540VJC9_9CHLR|nr:ABC transporter ATP-binding protein [Litorilinea aerophila]MCC9075709.1 ABC transporter ATP-binding protein [Litorilinea aerophila]